MQLLQFSRRTLLLMCAMVAGLTIVGIQIKDKTRPSFFLSRNSANIETDDCVANTISDEIGNIPNIIVRHLPQCIAQYEAALGSSPAQRIPRIRHILWKSRNVSTYFARQLKSWHDIQPDWKYVLWRDADMDKFVAKHYAGVLQKFRSLPDHIMRVDTIRYMLMHKFGGVYADLDYVLVKSLDRFLKFPAVVTRETEAHSLLHFGMGSWPPHVMANPAFLMSEPRNHFFHYCIMQLMVRAHKGGQVLQFAGPLGLSELLHRYTGHGGNRSQLFANDTVVVPASNSFYPFGGSGPSCRTSELTDRELQTLTALCRSVRPQQVASANISAFCKNSCDIELITDLLEPVYAVHDTKKPASAYSGLRVPVFHDSPVDIATVLPGVVMADTVY